MITDRLRFTVIEVNSDKILSRDLVVQEPEVMWRLSAPAIVSFKLPPGEYFKSAQGIKWTNWGQWIITELEINGARRIIAATIVSKNTVDPTSGVMQIESTGFMGYPDKIPFLENFNPIAVDPFEIVQRVWAHCQEFSNAQLGVEVQPASSGTQMLPGYSFDGSTLSFDFFAVFYRAIDFPDCQQIIEGLARDIPFDMYEHASWNEDRTSVTKTLQLAYPLGGFRQDYLVFRVGDNVLSAERSDEMDIEPVSDVIVRSWAPGKTISSQVSNYDPTRLRRVIMEEAAYVDSQERAAAWAKRKLQRRNVPAHFQKITIDANHPNAPAGSFDVGDSIFITAPDFPWYGTIEQWHRITSIIYKEAEGTMDLELKVEGAFNYDPIEYDPNYAQQPTEDLNRLSNGYFRDNMLGWKVIKGQWIRVPTDTYTVGLLTAVFVRIDLDDNGEALRSNRVTVTPGEHLSISCIVKWEEVESGSTDAFQLLGLTSSDGVPVDEIVFDEYINPTGAHGIQVLEINDWVVPIGVNELAIQLNVTDGVSAGKAFWTYARILPVGTP